MANNTALTTRFISRKRALYGHTVRRISLRMQHGGLGIASVLPSLTK